MADSLPVPPDNLRVWGGPFADAEPGLPAGEFFSEQLVGATERAYVEANLHD